MEQEVLVYLLVPIQCPDVVLKIGCLLFLNNNYYYEFRIASDY